MIAEKKLKAGARLPPLLLVVLYNGVSRWKAPGDVRDLIALSRDSTLWPWQPQVRYHLLDMRDFPGEKLARRTSLVALLFRLEQELSPEELKGLIDEVLKWVRQHPDYTELRQLFTELVRRAYTGLEVPGPIPEDLQEMRTNLDNVGETWKRKWKAEGLAEGLAEGKAEGLAEGEANGIIRGKAEALVSVLAEKFGAVRPSVLERIRAANLATLECWLRRAIAAPDLHSVFSPSS